MDTAYEIVDHTLRFTMNGKLIEIDLRQAIWPISTFSLFYLLFFKKSGFNSDQLLSLKKQSENAKSPDDKEYQPQDVNIPVVGGWLINLFRRIARSPFGRSVVSKNSKRDAGLDIFLKLSIPDKPTYYPILPPDEDIIKISQEHKVDFESLLKPSEADGFHYNTISDYNKAYREKRLTPSEIAQRVIAAIKKSHKTTTTQPNMRMISVYDEENIMKLANESTERWAANKPLSIFDGIPVAVKEEILLGDYRCRQGLPIDDLGYGEVIPVESEGQMVRRLREGGAMFIGMSNMHQIGIGVTGINQSKLHGTARNPVNPQYPPGGSSSGSAAAVASGLCPVALGADGGGSIRLPAAICGVVGAKASFARISGTGMRDGTDTLGHPGALCATTRDSALTYAFIAGKDPNYPIGLVQPEPTLYGFEETDLKSVRIGIDWTFFNDCVPEIAEVCRKAVEYLQEKRGATLVEISIPELQNTETELNLSMGATFTGEEYFKAQKQRTRSINILKRLFKSVDCILTPAFGEFQPKLTESMLEYGYFDLPRAAGIMRFAPQGNLTGIPGITVPAGYSSTTGLPIGLQIMAPWWREDVMFRMANATEGLMQLKKPQVYFDLINDSSSDLRSDDESE
eukprot:TCONS_00032916-protein